MKIIEALATHLQKTYNLNLHGMTKPNAAILERDGRIGYLLMEEEQLEITIKAHKSGFTTFDKIDKATIPVEDPELIPKLESIVEKWLRTTKPSR